MKRISAALFALLLALSVAACGILDGNPADVPSGTESGAQGAQGEPAAIENEVELSLDKASYDREERIEVTLDWGKLDQSAAVIVIVPSEREHGSEAAVHDDYEEYRYLSDFTELPFYMWAPDKDGLFDVRVYENGDGGRELACIAIAVGGAELPAASSGGGEGGEGGEDGEGGEGALLTGNEGVSTYAEAYTKYEAVYTALNDAYMAVLEPHNAAIEQENGEYWDDPQHFSDYMTGFINIPIAYTATFGMSDYEQGVAAIFEIFDYKDGKVEELDGANYRMSYIGVYNDPDTWESTEGAQWESLCGFDAEKGALYFRQYVTLDGEQKLDSFIEFIPIGGGRYALQSEHERGIVELVDGEATFDYAAFSTRFDPDAAGIFPDASGVDEAWITAGEGITQHITLTAESLHIWAAEITEGLMAAPERDITIER